MLDPVQLLTVDPSLGTDLHERLEDAARDLIVDTLELSPGPWPDARWTLARTDVGLLVLDGWIAREVQLERRLSCDIVGPGDVVQPPAGDGDSLLPVTVEWSVLTPARLAVITQQSLRPWPEVERQVMARLAGRSLRLAFEHAIAAVPGIEARIVMYLTHLSAYWGTVTTEGIVVSPALSHTRLAQLVGSRRPTVTAALTRLQADGTLARRPDGAWVLCAGSDRPPARGAAPARRPLPPAPVVADGAAPVRGAAPARAPVSRPVPAAPVAATAPTSDPMAHRFQVLAEQLEVLDARRRAHFEELLARTSSVREGAAEMVAKTRRMREDRSTREGPPDASAPPPGRADRKP